MKYLKDQAHNEKGFVMNHFFLSRGHTCMIIPKDSKVDF